MKKFHVHLKNPKGFWNNRYIVKKDLLDQFRKQFPVPTYVVEFLLGRYCATTDPEEIAEGLEIVKRQPPARKTKNPLKNYLPAS